MGAIDGGGTITPHGKRLASLPLPPNLAHMVLVAAASGQAEDAGRLTLLLQERGLGGQGEDIEARFERFQRERGGRADAAKSLAQRIAKMAGKEGSSPSLSIGQLVATAFPDRIAKRRDSKGETWLSAMGRGLRLDPASPLARAEWLAVADMQGAASGARIMSAAALTEAEVLAAFADRMETATEARYDKIADRVEVRERRRLGAIILAEGSSSAIEPEVIAIALAEAVQQQGIDVLPWSEAAIALRQRAAYSGFDALSDVSLTASMADWLMPILSGVNRLRDVSRTALFNALDHLLGWEGKQQVEKIAPANFASPAGTSHAIDYASEAGPTVELRVQALFGLDEHPVVGADRVPLVLSLTSPSRPPDSDHAQPARILAG